jgi:exodeoxyribonuclease V gamma subunit
LRLFFNKKFGIYLEDIQRIETEERFQLSHSDKASLLRKGIKQDFKDVIQQAEKSGKLPHGLLKELGKDALKEEIAERISFLKSQGIAPEDLFEIEFADRFLVPQKTEKGNWQVPALKIFYKEKCHIVLHGKLQDVSVKGILLHRELKRSDIVKAWPSFLILQCLIMDYNLPIEPNALFAKDGKIGAAFSEHPKNELENLLNHYFIALEHPSPLLPEWTQDLVKGSEKDRLRESWQEQQNDSYHVSYNEYLKWMMRGSELPELHQSAEQWMAKAKEVYGGPFSKWMGKA